MSIVAPKGRKHRCAAALVRVVRRGFATMPDERRGETAIACTEARLSACARCARTSPSRLAFDQQRVEGTLGTIDAMGPVPGATQMRASLEPVGPDA